MKGLADTSPGREFNGGTHKSVTDSNFARVVGLTGSSPTTTDSHFTLQWRGGLLRMVHVKHGAKRRLYCTLRHVAKRTRVPAKDAIAEATWHRVPQVRSAIFLA